MLKYCPYRSEEFGCLKQSLEVVGYIKEFQSLQSTLRVLQTARINQMAQIGVLPSEVLTTLQEQILLTNSTATEEAQKDKLVGLIEQAKSVLNAAMSPQSRMVKIRTIANAVLTLYSRFDMSKFESHFADLFPMKPEDKKQEKWFNENLKQIREVEQKLQTLKSSSNRCFINDKIPDEWEGLSVLQMKSELAALEAALSGDTELSEEAICKAAEKVAHLKKAIPARYIEIGHYVCEQFYERWKERVRLFNNVPVTISGVMIESLPRKFKDVWKAAYLAFELNKVPAVQYFSPKYSSDVDFNESPDTNQSVGFFGKVTAANG